MDDLISREAFDEVLKNAQCECKKNGGNFRVGVLSTVRANLANQPSVPAVPLDKLCEWLSETSTDIPCESCKYFVNDNCTAIGDASRPCPNSADEWRRSITKWMEGQDAAD